MTCTTLDTKLGVLTCVKFRSAINTLVVIWLVWLEHNKHAAHVLPRRLLPHICNFQEISNPAHTVPLRSSYQIKPMVESLTFTGACHFGWSDM